MSETFKLEMEDICAILNLNRLMDRRTGNLSGGERQRVALARALANDHKILLLDEPFTALHQMLKVELWSMLKDLKKKYDLTILLVTHDLEECFFLADDISVIYEGRILQTGPKEEVMKKPSHKLVAELLGYFVYLDEGRLPGDPIKTIRSEEVEILTKRESHLAGELIEGVVETIYELRETWHIMVRPAADQGCLMRIVANELKVQVNDTVYLHFNPEKIFEIQI